MIRIGILGDIGSGKSYVAKNFGYPVFNADIEVGKIYRTDKKVFNKLKKVLPKFFNSFPIKKEHVSDSILANKKNIREITLFPMNQNAQDLMMNAPSKIEERQLRELGLKIDKKKN